MQMPFRPKMQAKQLLEKEEPLYLTQGAIERMKHRLVRIEEEELPQAIADVRRTGEFGDFSENAEYQEAKGRMRRLRDQAAGIEHKLAVAIEIQADGSSSVQIGSTVALERADGSTQTFHIVGPQEADPVRGKLSFKSPLGAKLMGRCVGERVELTTATGTACYTITLIS